MKILQKLKKRYEVLKQRNIELNAMAKDLEKVLGGSKVKLVKVVTWDSNAVLENVCDLWFGTEELANKVHNDAKLMNIIKKCMSKFDCQYKGSHVNGDEICIQSKTPKLIAAKK